MFADDDLHAIAAGLCGGTVLAVTPVLGGGNNRLYRVDTAAGRFALKCYGPLEARGDRLGNEFDGLRFLATGGAVAAPAPIATDRGRRMALYEWIDGGPANPAPADGIAQALAFVATLRHAGDTRPAGWVGTATEACLSGVELLRQIDRRLAALGSAPDLAGFLSEEVAPLRTLAGMRMAKLYADAGLDPSADIPMAGRVLSPSDFGFHNAVRRPDGRLVFVDFEYFGWDDPVKLTADLPWHPGMTLSPDQGRAWLAGTAALFGQDPSFAVRLSAQIPLFGLRWCLIVLNEFLPERWLRRLAAGGSDLDWQQAKATQLAKARGILARVSKLAAIDDPPSLSSFQSPSWSPLWTTGPATSDSW
jgi:hypothetical protein